MICRAYGCPNEAMDGQPFCGFHDEVAEVGAQIRLKVGRPKGTTKPKPFPQEVRRPKCSARTKKGTERCMNQAAEGSDLCGIHRALKGVRHA